VPSDSLKVYQETLYLKRFSKFLDPWETAQGRFLGRGWNMFQELEVEERVVFSELKGACFGLNEV
jgi:hypothetical protein